MERGGKKRGKNVRHVCGEKKGAKTKKVQRGRKRRNRGGGGGGAGGGGGGGERGGGSCGGGGGGKAGGRRGSCATSIYKRNLHQLVRRNGRGSCRGVGTQRARPCGEAVMSAGLINRPAISNGMLS